MVADLALGEAPDAGVGNRCPVVHGELGQVLGHQVAAALGDRLEPTEFVRRQGEQLHHGIAGLCGFFSAT
ncbi:hypothetical protein FQZ97_1099580 [compost metagenome]